MGTIEIARFDLDARAERRLAALVGPPDKWRETRDFQIGLLERFGLRPTQRLLDIGCGTLRAGLPLIGYLDPGRYHGVDVDRGCIDAAEALVQDFDLARSKSPRIARSDSFGLEEFGAGPKMDVIWVYQVFIHLTPALSARAMAAIGHLLAPGGDAYVTVRPRDDGGRGLTQFGTWRSYANTAGAVEDYAALAAEAGLACAPLGTLGDFGLSAARRGSAYPMLRLTRMSGD